VKKCTWLEIFVQLLPLIRDPARAVLVSHLLQQRLWGAFRSDSNAKSSLALRTQQRPAFSIFIKWSSSELASSHVVNSWNPQLLSSHHSHSGSITLHRLTGLLSWWLKDQVRLHSLHLIPYLVSKCPTTSVNPFPPIWLRCLSKLNLTPPLWFWHFDSSAFPDCFYVCV
jgi:hypothetical protein